MKTATDEIETIEKADETPNARYRAYLEAQYAISALRGRYAPYLIVAIASAVLIPSALHRAWVAAAVIYFGVFLVATRGIAMMRHEYRKLSRIAEEWQAVSAVLTQASPGLFRSGFLDLPCTVVFSFEDVDYETLNEISERVTALKDASPEAPERAEIAAMLASPAVRSRRKLLPAALTGGRTVYLADLFVNRRYLEKGYLTHRTIPCFAERGNIGGLEMMPYQIVEKSDEEDETSKIAPPAAPLSAASHRAEQPR